MEEDEEVFGIVGKGGLENDLGFLEGFLGGRDNLFYFAKNKVGWNVFCRFGKNIVVGADWREIGKIDNLGQIVGVTILTFDTRRGMNGKTATAIGIEGVDFDDGAGNLGNGTQKNFVGDKRLANFDIFKGKS